MFTYVSPAEAGVSAKQIQKYIQVLEKHGIETHDIILARGNQIFFEQYWSPLNADFPHRMYSATKSYVAIAVGFAIQDGLVALDDKVVDYFPEDVPENVLEHVRNQTVRNMLMMSTGYVQSCGNWFADQEDRVKFYFQKNTEPVTSSNEFSKIPGTFFDYDSTGSFILGALVERVTKKGLNEYLREKLFDKIGVSDKVRFLKCPGGHTWGDSALICTALDFLKVARFTLNYGSWNGEQILSKEYLMDATSDLISTGEEDNSKSFGYGYQIWRTWNNSFFFNGACSQLAVCVPDKDIIMVYNGFNDAMNEIIFRFFEEIVETASDEPIVEDEETQESLEAYCKTLELKHIKKNVPTGMQEKVNGRTYWLNDNPMGITTVRLDFSGDKGMFTYENAQGLKKLEFGICHNVPSVFPQEGYSGEVGALYAPGNYYKCQVSAGWLEERKFRIVARILDDYLGGFRFTFYFVDEDKVAFLSTGGGENFGKEYRGYAEGSYEKAD